MAVPNQGIMFGNLSGNRYDGRSYYEHVGESVGPLTYKLDPIQSHNPAACMSVFGPRASKNGLTVGTQMGPVVAPAQAVTDTESMLTNRNIANTKSRDARMSNIDVTKYTLQSPKICDGFTDPIATHLTNPPYDYREMSINRFYNLNNPAQANLYWDRAANTKLEARDNYHPYVPKPMNQYAALPNPKCGNLFRPSEGQCIIRYQKSELLG
jgi:hypothetical protein